jgi:hypothetical protein
MSPSHSADLRNHSLAGRDESPALSTTPTLRLLEVTCGLDRSQLEKILNASPASTRFSFHATPGQTSVYHTFGVITCALLLSATVAAFIVSLN